MSATHASPTTDTSHAAADTHDHHGIAHVASLSMLVKTWVFLMFLTVITVLATKVDFGPSMNLALAMFIATVKATLVVLYFMHLRYDKIFHSVLFVGAILASALFVGFALMDGGQYQQSVVWDAEAVPAAPHGPRPTAQ